MSEQEQPFSEWLAETERRWLDDGRMTVVNIRRFFRELRQRDEELGRLRTQWQAMKDETLLNQRECERLRSQLQSQAALAESLARDNDELRLKDKACNGR